MCEEVSRANLLRDVETFLRARCDAIQIPKETFVEYWQWHEDVMQQRMQEIRPALDELQRQINAPPVTCETSLEHANRISEMRRRQHDLVQSVPQPEESDVPDSLKVVYRARQALSEARRKQCEALKTYKTVPCRSVEPIHEILEELDRRLNQLLDKVLGRSASAQAAAQVTLADLDAATSVLAKFEAAGASAEQLSQFKDTFNTVLNQLYCHLTVKTLSRDIKIRVCAAESVWDLKGKLARDMKHAGWDAHKIQLNLISELGNTPLGSRSASLFDCGVWRIAQGSGGSVVAAQTGFDLEEQLETCQREHDEVVAEALKFGQKCAHWGVLVDNHNLTSPEADDKATEETKFTFALLIHAILHEELDYSAAAQLYVMLYLHEIDYDQARRDILRRVPCDGETNKLYKEQVASLKSKNQELNDTLVRGEKFLEHHKLDLKETIEAGIAAREYEIIYQQGVPIPVPKAHSTSASSRKRSTPAGKSYPSSDVQTQKRLKALLPDRSVQSHGSQMSMSTAVPDSSPSSDARTGETCDHYYAMPLHLIENKVITCARCRTTIYGMPCDELQPDRSARGPFHLGCVEGFSEGTPRWITCRGQVSWSNPSPTQ